MARGRTDSPQYTVQDFSAVNQYIDHLAQRHHARASQWRADTFGSYAKWTSIFVGAGGAAAFLALWGVALLKEKPEPKIVVPVVVDRPVTVNIPERPAAPPQSDPRVDQKLGEIARRIDELKAGRPNNATIPVGSPGKEEPVKTIIDFVIFKNIDFSRAGIKEVVVGMKYKDANAKKPDHQWCYVTKANLGGTSIRVDLAHKFDDRQVPSILTLAEAREMRVDLTDLNAAQRLCAFE